VAKAKLRITENFIENLSQIYSPRLLLRIRNVLEMLATNPEVGSPLARQSLVVVFGEGIRTFALSTFVLVYRFDGDYVDVLALIYGSRIV
jgi:plasmid stabilization system protein ParE